MLIQRGPNPQAWDSAQRAAAAAGCPELECWAARTRSSTKSSAVSSCRHTALQHRLLTAAWLRTPPSQLCRVRHQTSPPSPLARAAAQLTTRSDPPAKLSEQGSCLCGRGACAGFARYNPRPFSRQIQRPSGEEWRGVERTGEGGGGSGLGPAGLHQLLRIIIRPSLRHHVLHQHRPHAVRRRRRACAVSESSVILLTSPLHPY